MTDPMTDPIPQWDPGAPVLYRSPVTLLTLLLPFALLVLHLVVLYLLVSPRQFALVVGLMVAYMLPPAGKETVIPTGIALGVPWWVIAGAIAMLDIETGLFMAFNFDLAFRLPFIGEWLQGFADTGRDYIRHHRWLQKFYFSGIVFLVLVPFFGSGGIRGSVIGRLLGMGKDLVFLAIVVGAVLGCLLIAVFSGMLINSLCAAGSVPAGIAATVCGNG